MGAGSVYRPRRPTDRSPADTRSAAVVAGGLGLVALGALVALAGLLTGVDHALFRALNRVPIVLAPAAFLAEVGAFLLVLLVAALALVGRLHRLALELFTAGLIAWLAVEALVKPLVTRPRPALVLPEAVARVGLGGSAFPATHLAVACTIVLLASPSLPRWGRAAAWVVVGVIALGRAHLGAELPSDLIAGAGVGLVVGGGWRLLGALGSRR